MTWLKIIQEYHIVIIVINVFEKKRILHISVQNQLSTQMYLNVLLGLLLLFISNE